MYLVYPKNKGIFWFFWKHKKNKKINYEIKKPNILKLNFNSFFEYK